MNLLLILHLFAATIWVGGHFYLCVAVLPRVLKNRSPQTLLNFEKSYEPIGLPALLVLIITGVWMAYRLGVPVNRWFSFETGIEKLVSIKLILLFITFALALHAQTRVLPKLRNKTLPLMAFHILAVTLIGIAMLVLGSMFRYGGI